jgi:16S rRNA (uracil1498-N3)-methyltransferase
MNLVLFEPAELNQGIPAHDPRVRHVREVLKRATGQSFDAGIIDGPRGRAAFEPADGELLRVCFTPGPSLPPLPEVILIVGLARPQTARDILRDATTLGATQLWFTPTERSDPNYATSSLWSSGETRRHLLAGAAQAFDPRLPSVQRPTSLAAALAAVPLASARVALDNYESTGALAHTRVPNHATVVLAVGPERGWGPQDRMLLREHDFALRDLGPRVLRTETAVIAALSWFTALRRPV